MTKIINKFSHLLLFGVLVFSQGLRAQTTETTYYIPDALGSPIAAMDEAGNIKWRKHYQPYGQEIEQGAASQDNRIGYTGHVHDRASGLTYMGARYYDPGIGRFLSMDPAAVDPGDPRTFNRFVYAINNSYGFVDPDGRNAALAACGAGPVACLIGVGVTALALSQGINAINSQGAGGSSNNIPPLADFGTPMPDPGDDFEPPELRGTQVGLRNESLVDKLKSDMQGGSFKYQSPEGRISGYIDSNGVRYVSEGHHRVAAAREILKETGNSGPLNNLVRNGNWTDVSQAPANSRPLPARDFWGNLRNRIGF